MFLVLRDGFVVSVVHDWQQALKEFDTISGAEPSGVIVSVIEILEFSAGTAGQREIRNFIRNRYRETEAPSENEKATVYFK